MFGFLKKALKKGDPAAPDTPAPEAPAAPAAVEPAPAHAPVAAPLSTPAPAPTPAPASQAAPAPTPEPGKKRSWMDRLRAGLSRTREQIGGGLGGLTSLFSRRKIDEELLEELETTLLMADCGVEATQHLIKELRLRWKRDKLETADQLQSTLAEGLQAILTPLEKPLEVSTHTPYIIMIAGINGSGKTTSIGKLAKHFQNQGKSVLLAAGDTFRAAAREQLMTWGERNGVAVIAQESGDPAAVVFDAISAARARNIDIVLADTAGRLPTQLHLMEEIAKVRRVIQKAEPSGPHEVLLVLDANIGQNAIQQVKAFDAAIGVTGLVLTKLDGTAKGGVVAAIARQCPKPLRFIGVGEQIDDLQVFRAKEFVDALFTPLAGQDKSAG
ncbi:signal recognition particle-docking protein FtsY [Zoogloea sp.]|uniref:signal recognition particle-docking protein FtsY n=1 Tax=Zoogloea sp. TaxID=49181 RepID=UPI00260A66CD|nr:signal recognition particle-docking protein FtsY [Zoogloea sp.]MDD3355231.1 signal recognition particle-docking protein FtsY [Zoogloea sp.]